MQLACVMTLLTSTSTDVQDLSAYSGDTWTSSTRSHFDYCYVLYSKNPGTSSACTSVLETDI